MKINTGEQIHIEIKSKNENERRTNTYKNKSKNENEHRRRNTHRNKSQNGNEYIPSPSESSTPMHTIPVLHSCLVKCRRHQVSSTQCPAPDEYWTRDEAMYNDGKVVLFGLERLGIRGGASDYCSL